MHCPLWVSKYPSLLQGPSAPDQSSWPPCWESDWTLLDACEVQEARSTKAYGPPCGIQTSRVQVNENIKEIPVENSCTQSCRENRGTLRPKKWSKQTIMCCSSKHKQHICRGHTVHTLYLLHALTQTGNLPNEFISHLPFKDKRWLSTRRRNVK